MFNTVGEQERPNLSLWEKVIKAFDHVKKRQGHFRLSADRLTNVHVLYIVTRLHYTASYTRAMR